MAKTEEEKLEAQRISIVKSKAKEYGWEYFLDGDARNFHMITQEGIRLGREEWHNMLEDHSAWYVLFKDGTQIRGSYESIIEKFVKDYNTYRGNVITL